MLTRTPASTPTAAPPRRRIGVRLLAAIAPLTGLLVALPATATAAPAGPATIEQAVVSAMEAVTGRSRATSAAQGRDFQVTVDRRAGGWASGVAVRRAPAVEGAYPDAWVFLARADRGTWSATLDTDPVAFGDRAAEAPAGVFSRAEKSTFTTRAAVARGASVQQATGLQLPFKIGQTWVLTQGPHNWNGGSTAPLSAIDLAGGDQRVMAAAGGNVYTLCTSAGTNNGWRRMYHPNGLTTDYYHLWDLKAKTNGQWVNANGGLGHTGTDVCAGGSATGRHVHFALLEGTARISIVGRTVGQWTFWSGPGRAVRGGTTVYQGGSIYNHGP